MRAFRREKDGSLSARFTVEERSVLVSLADQVAGLLAVRGSLPGDPVLTRLLPDAYRGDADAASEFRRFTEDSLAARKIQNAITVTESLERATAQRRLPDRRRWPWMRRRSSPGCAASRTSGSPWLPGLESSRMSDEGADDDETLMLRDVYDWLGFVQGSLIEALER